MIKYSLNCENDHSFEAWFSNSDDFEAQKLRHLVSCPFCNSEQIEKALMTPSVSTGKNKLVGKEENENATPPTKSDGPLTPVVNAAPPAEVAQMVEKFRQLRHQIEAGSENVGKKFSREARKIHYGETEKRGIYGQASEKDVKELLDEGIDVMPLPPLPEDNN